MAEASLFCAVIGVERVFLVDIAQSKTVGNLKIAIKDQKIGVLGEVDAERLQLFWPGTTASGWQPILTMSSR
ncbi:hypothetical protein F441_14467 [Phytophthora nicotianae CJ01A1]|uniref:Crinkler effector protein N-terminal domain-containing protein n=3 Tax=Phytophthora nicotianae TaxID=4792 RepID=V9ELL8_PHYNI|nr:hypothetical protein F443_14597 [Phytophthora nicotianae P1569]ETK79965.1 hypothetical protein L915_14230 [Phytophthora nicotianae]ETL33383.1 hypothetical protein L916_14135 [Phytophthora nicotianae]ETL86659.1 hypothetical protein L917_13916 [Phytophthora nicotianae]ETP09672.1 hypothetical protein F441_14467 [Phytophthora nicotianae CJ01A1]